MDKYGKPILSLFLIAVIASLILAYSYEVTRAPAEAQKIKTTNEAMKSVLPAATEFETTETDNEDVIGVTVGYDDNQEEVGYVVETLSTGYSSTLDILVGFDLDMVVTGVEILSHSETPGLGANATNPEFKDQYIGSSGPFVVTKTPSTSPEEIDAMTGATITSDAVTLAVNNAIDYMNNEGKELINE